MASGDWPPYMWPTALPSTYLYSTCEHGTPLGHICWWCRPASAAPPLQLGGWVCAGCGHGYAPSVTECPYCPQQKPAGDSAFGRFEPILPVPMDEPASPRPEPRRWEYPVCSPPGRGGLASLPMSDLCAQPAEGGLCGCGEDEDTGPCTSVDCGC